jgi:DNA-binding SARP family transcriptional activator
MAEALSIDLLGPLAIRSGYSDLSVGPARQQALLAVLALRATTLAVAVVQPAVAATLFFLVEFIREGASDGKVIHRPQPEHS